MERKNASFEVKQRNRNNVFRVLKENDSLTKLDIVNLLGISLPTVAQNILDLQAEGLVTESGYIGYTGGRRAKTYSLVPNARTAIGIDITRHNITAVAVDLRGAIIARIHEKIKYERSDAYFRALGNIVNRIVEEASIDPYSVLGVGIGVPGLITVDNQKVFYGEILNFTGMSCEELCQYIEFPSALFNDANASGFAESWIDPNLENAFYIMLSNNVGGAIYLNKGQYCGENIRAGEVGHIIIVPDGKQCYCGQKGCVDAYCAATVLSSLTNGDLNAFFEELDAGNAEAISLWGEYLTHLANTVIDIRMLFDCKVIIGGYVGAYIDKYLDDLKSRIAGKSSFEDNADYIISCKFKTEAIATGAALNFIEDFLKTI